ncbi:MAG TPA: DUF4097 family beta strand repeat-containing protein [Bryobacteraceae bacterium]|nr:DUF4097 family beta strand repeat-containing protein [Bryobacteraceae bacterium]
MRPRSVTGPFVLLAIGVFFLINNIRPDLISLSRIADYWPFLLIGAGVIGLVEVLFHASRGAAVPPRPIAGGSIFWILILGIFIITVSRNHNFRFGGFDAPGVSVFGSDYDYDVSASESPRGVTRIVLDNLRGNLSLKGEDQGDIKVSGRKTVRSFNRADADRANQQSQVHVERHGDELFIRTDDFGGPRLLQISIDLDITVPRGISVESRGRTGDLTIDDVDGPVDVSAGRGDVRLSHIGKDVKIEASRSGEIHVTDVMGSVDLQGRGGDIQFENIAGPVTINGEYAGTLEFRALASPMHFNSSRTEFQLQAVPGSVTMDLGNLKLENASGPVRFKTGVRDIEAADVAGALDLTIDRGDIHVTVNKTPVPKMDIRTRNGDISVALPEKAEFQLDGSTSRGDISNEFGGGLHTQSDGHAGTIQGHVGNGPSVNLSTDRGTISIRKS